MPARPAPLSLEPRAPAEAESGAAREACVSVVDVSVLCVHALLVYVFCMQFVDCQTIVLSDRYVMSCRVVSCHMSCHMSYHPMPYHIQYNNIVSNSIM